jgi:hypothetical protein
MHTTPHTVPWVAAIIVETTLRPLVEPTSIVLPFLNADDHGGWLAPGTS